MAILNEVRNLHAKDILSIWNKRASKDRFRPEVYGFPPCTKHLVCWTEPHGMAFYFLSFRITAAAQLQIDVEAEAKSYPMRRLYLPSVRDA